MLKILQARLQQYMNQECLDVQAEFGKLSSGQRTGKSQFLFQSQNRMRVKKQQLELDMEQQTGLK